jgi:predicted Zn-dependent protease
VGPRRLTSIALLAVLCAGCAVAPLSGEPDLWLQSEERERALAEAIYPDLVWQDGGPMPPDPALHGYLGGIVTALTRVSERPDLAVDFSLLHSSSLPRAWALSTHVAASRGLVTVLASEAEFAFVMGRELAHLAARHVPGRHTPALLGPRALGVAAPAAGRPARPDLRVLGQLVLGVDAPGGGLRLAFDADQELEADRLGVLYMMRAGYDPAQAARALERLGRSTERYRQVRDGPRPEVVPHQARARDLDAFVRQLQPAKAACCPAPGRGDRAPGDPWLRHTAALRELAPAYAAYERAMRAFRDGSPGDVQGPLAEALRLGDQAPFWTLLGALRITEGRLAEAEAAFEQALGRFPGYQPALQGLGLAAFADGRFVVATGHLRESLRRRPGFAPAEFALGLSLAALDQPAAAAPYLRAAAESDPGHPEVHGVLARALEKTGQRREAVQAWQAQLRVAPDSALGLEGRQRLQAIAAGDDSKSRAARGTRFADQAD